MNWETPALIVLFWMSLYNFFVCGFWGCYVSGARNRQPAEGFFLGFMLGPIGVAVAACLPTIVIPIPVVAAPPGAAPLPPFLDDFVPATRAMRGT